MRALRYPFNRRGYAKGRPHRSEPEEEGEILRRIVAFLLAYYESRSLVIRVYLDL